MAKRPWVRLEGLGEVNGIRLDDYGALVTATACEVEARAQRRVTREELLTPGWQGLRRAAERFRPELGWKFTTLAKIRIRGSMLDYLRAVDWESRVRRQRGQARKQVELSRMELEGGLVDLPEFRIEEESFERLEARDEVEVLMRKRLMPSERQVVRWYYLEGKTLAEIGELIGLTEARTSQKLSDIRSRMGGISRAGHNRRT